MTKMFHHRQNSLLSGVLEPPLAISRLWGNSIMWKRGFKFSFKTVTNTVTKAHYIAGFSCTRQNLLSTYLCFLVSLNVISPLFHDIKESRPNDEKYSKMSKDAKQYALQTLLKLAMVQNMPRSSLFSEDIYALIKSCSCFFEILYYILHSFGI